MPQFLRPALYWRHRAAGYQGGDRRRPRRGLQRLCGRRRRCRSADGARALPVGGVRRGAVSSRAGAARLPGEPPRGRKLSVIRRTPQHRRAQRADGADGAGGLMAYLAPMIPANAPFTPAQQAWLNGLLAGLLGPDGAGAPDASVIMAALDLAG